MEAIIQTKAYKYKHNFNLIKKRPYKIITICIAGGLLTEHTLVFLSASRHILFSPNISCLTLNWFAFKLEIQVPVSPITSNTHLVGRVEIYRQFFFF